MKNLIPNDKAGIMDQGLMILAITMLLMIIMLFVSNIEVMTKFVKVMMSLLATSAMIVALVLMWIGLKK